MERARGGDKEKIIIGICAMESKCTSKPMREILRRLEATGNFEIIIFGNDTILHKPVLSWPACDCLIGFYSKGFPIDKAAQYAELCKHRTFIVNDFSLQRILLDRRSTSSITRLHCIPTPKQVVVSRDGLPSLPFSPDNPGALPSFLEKPDSIVVNNFELIKPFVEKPVDGEDHNIYIYYHSSDGGGSTRLFRKVDNKSSSYHPDCSNIRTDGQSYIYERFVPTVIPVEGDESSAVQRDLKLYTVGENFVYAETRKSPEVDGTVDRLPDGREKRDLVPLTDQEKEIANAIVRSFHQRVCGFDILRSEIGSYVCDVNGWSFVKGNHNYYNECARILNELFIQQKNKLDHYPKESAPLDKQWKLKGLVSIIRHADRTPKQKVKVQITHEAILQLFVENNCTDKEVKMKSDKNQQELANLLNILTKILDRKPTEKFEVPPTPCPSLSSSTSSSDSETLTPPNEDLTHLNLKEDDRAEEASQRKAQKKKNQLKEASLAIAEENKLKLICSVLSNFYQGLKIQIKPMKVIELSNGNKKVIKALLICKWGGVLTKEGEIQSWRLGKFYRENVINDHNRVDDVNEYFSPPPIICSNIERRVKRTAELFGAGLMNQEFTEPAPVIENSETNHLLGDISLAKEFIDEMKKKLSEVHHEFLMKEVREHLINSGVTALKEMGCSGGQQHNPLFFLLTDLMNYLQCIVARIDNLMHSPCPPPYVSSGEALPLMQQRWKRLTNDFYNLKTQKFDITKVPDVEDYIKYDIIHNRSLFNDSLLVTLFFRAKVLADFVVPREYGWSKEDKLKIGYLTCNPLCNRIVENIQDIMSGNRSSSIYLHFTSESHVHPLLNLLFHNSVVPVSTLDFFRELNYLTQVIFKVYENTSLPSDDQNRFLIQLFYSVGAIGDALACTSEDNQILPVVPAICIHPGVTIEQLKQIFFDSIQNLL